ncbi:MAG TPA: ATP-dependent zinc protease, partial [Halomonas sp.]|nr:ATP-dependent zinc protease [Halomonas sp.]
ELSLTDRRDMRHPMLLGRRALRRLLVAPGAAFLHGEP